MLLKDSEIDTIDGETAFMIPYITFLTFLQHGNSSKTGTVLLVFFGYFVLSFSRSLIN